MTGTTFHKFLWYGFLIVLLSACTTSRKVQGYDFTLVTNQVQNWIDSGYYNGASLLFAKNDTIVYESYFGNYDTNTVAYIASAGKWLTAATIAAVVDERKLSWDDSVKKWLPGFTDVKGDATLRQLLSHTAGFPDYQPKNERPDNYQTLKESVEHIANLPADTLPGTKFKYGGLAMQVAGRMAELATGKDWETLFQQKIAIPLGMEGTHFTPVDTTPGYNPMLGGGARTNLHDFVKFLEMIYHDGVYKGKRILSGSAIDEMQKNQVGNATVSSGEYVQKARVTNRNDIYGLGQWREEVTEGGKATLISSPSWAGAYPWIDKKTGVFGFFLARVSNIKNGFSPFYSSPILPMQVREMLKEASLKP